MHTTNYYNTFIEVAEDCPATIATVPPQKGEGKTAAGIQFALINAKAYQYTSDDVLFQVHAAKNKISSKDFPSERERFFSKGQPCFRASPLAKRYGWGIHSNEEGKIALYAVESDEYRKLAADKSLKHTKAMRTKR
jgi:hypothetical protein